MRSTTGGFDLCAELSNGSEDAISRRSAIGQFLPFRGAPKAAIKEMTAFDPFLPLAAEGQPSTQNCHLPRPHARFTLERATRADHLRSQPSAL